MLDLIKDYKGSLIINDKKYSDVKVAIQDFKNYDGDLTIVLNSELKQYSKRGEQKENEEKDRIYRIRVKQYMTKPATPTFDFMDKWNNGEPMPLRIMVGRKLQGTRGMVKMELWGDITEEQSTHCMSCGRVLTNKISQYFGIGPKCGNHDYVNPFDTEEELKEAVKEMRTILRNKKWTGWVIKSAIEEEEIIEGL